jgi:hypothetical protein
MEERKEKEAMDFVKRYHLTDILFFRGSPHKNADIYRLADDRKSFYWTTTPQSNLTLLQAAIYNQCFELAEFLMYGHKVLTSTRQQKPFDPRIILLNYDTGNDETLTQRLCRQVGNVSLFRNIGLWYN